MNIEIDYARHPAFQTSQGTAASNAAIRQYFLDTDRLWNVLVESGESEGEIIAAFNATHQTARAGVEKELVPYTDETYRRFVVQAFDRSADAILKEIVCITGARRQKGSGGAEEIAAKLRDISVVGFAMDPALRQRIANSLAPYMDILREQRRTNGGARCFVAVPSWGEHWNLIKQFLRKSQIEQGISAYAGYPLELSGYALTYSHPDETWFKQCYLDIGLEAPRTVQMHFDLDNTSAKSMLYLNEIEEEEGPFSYVPRKLAKMPSRSQLSFFKYFDYANSEFAESRSVSAGSYNRALFKSPELRQNFARLPSELQGSSCLGDDILDGTPLSDFLLDNEVKITSKVGDLALFAGGETLHRGGLVTKGERWALQMIYNRPLSYKKKVVQQTTSFLLRARNRYRELVS